MPNWRYLQHHADLEQIPIVYLPEGHAPMSESEHVEHAKTVFRQWHENAEEHLPDLLNEYAEWLLENASSWRETMWMVDVIANAYRPVT